MVPFNDVHDDGDHDELHAVRGGEHHGVVDVLHDAHHDVAVPRDAGRGDEHRGALEVRGVDHDDRRDDLRGSRHLVRVGGGGKTWFSENKAVWEEELNVIGNTSASNLLKALVTHLLSEHLNKQEIVFKFE
uniref:Uncharacterized protein n=1 Tax=Caenorhabditis japonica TaxID=281687 RepID=A0A8R1IJ29_CAEJA